jgi:hypothetical protein
LSAIEASAKEEWRDMILTGGPFDKPQRKGILAYCRTDIEATRELLMAMIKVMPRDLERALFRGRYAIPATLSETILVGRKSSPHASSVTARKG